MSAAVTKGPSYSRPPFWHFRYGMIASVAGTIVPGRLQAASNLTPEQIG